MEFEVVPVPTGRRDSFVGLVLDALQQIPPGQAVRFTLPAGKTTTTIRANLGAAAKSRSFYVSVHIADGTATVWKRKER